MRLPDVSDLVRRRVAIAPFLGLAVIGIEDFVDHDALLLEEDGARMSGSNPTRTRHAEQPVRVVALFAEDRQ